MEQGTSRSRLFLSATAILLGLVLAKTLLHFFTNGNYGYFRDEFYYAACADHLAWGYVDHPPLSILLLKITRALPGDSIFAIRLPVVLAGAACVFLTGMVAREMGGGRFAQVLAALAYMVMPISMAMATFFSMNAFDHLFWIACVLIVVRLLRTDNPRLWPLFGLVAGVGLMNKISVAFLGFGIVVGLLLTTRRRHFLSPWLWLGGAVALLIVLPNLIWQCANDFPTLEFMRNARNKITPLSPVGYVGAQLMMTGPLTAPIWVAGLAGFLFAKSLRPWRTLGIAYLAVLALFVFQQAKPYYLGPAYPMLCAGAGALIERIAVGGVARWLKPAAVGLLAVSGLLTTPMAVPLLPPETYLRYQALLGAEIPREERTHTAALPQIFADRFGWEETVAAVAEAYRSLPPEDRARCAIYADDYGDAGAVDFLGPRHGLPRAISTHNNYWLWGTHGATGEVVIAVGVSQEDMAEAFGRVELAATAIAPYSMEPRKPVFICRDPKGPINAWWSKAKTFI